VKKWRKKGSEKIAQFATPVSHYQLLPITNFSWR